jgi:hypothetical protein
MAGTSEGAGIRRGRPGGWLGRLFELYLTAAGGLEPIPVQDVRDDVTALNGYGYVVRL